MTTKERNNFCISIQKKHGQKILFALISLFLAIQFGSLALSAFAILLLSFNGIGYLASFAILLIMITGIFALHSGFCLILLKLIRNQPAILGDMIFPFKNFKRTFRNSIPFIITTLITSFAASLLIISITGFSLSGVNQEDFQNSQILLLILYGFAFLTLIINIPLIYIPFFDFDMQGKTPKEVKSMAFALFKESAKDLFSGCFVFSGKSILIFSVLLILSFLNIRVISVLASFFSSIYFFLAYSSVMLMTASVYQDFTQPDVEFEISDIENKEDHMDENKAE